MAITQLVSKTVADEHGAEGVEVLEELCGMKSTDMIHWHECPHHRESSKERHPDCNEHCREQGLFHLRTTLVGMVVATYEINQRDDSDFVAEVWDEKVCRVRHITYASTRGWTYANTATVDASQDIMIKAHIHDRALAYCIWLNETEIKGSIALVGRKVQVKSGKYKGTVGIVTWRGMNRFVRHGQKHRVKINPTKGQEIFVDAKRCRVCTLVANIKEYGEYDYTTASKYYKPNTLDINAFWALIKKRGIEMHQDDTNLERLEARIKGACE